MGFFLSGFEVDCVILPAAFALTNLCLCPWLSMAVFRILVSQILDRTEPVLYSSMSSETITVFQYYSYFASHSVNDLGSYLLQLAKEGRVHKFCWLVREYLPVLLSTTQGSPALRLALQKEERKETKEVFWLLSECTWTVVHVKGKELMQIDSQSLLFPYSNGEKTVLKALFFREWLMVVGWAQGLGSFLCPQLGWRLGLSPPVIETPSEVLSNSQEPRDHSTSEFCRLCHQELKREADATLSMLNCSPWQAKFSSLFEREFEEPCLVFLLIWAYEGAFAQKPGSKMAFQLNSETY